ncbi:MAG: radical SAM protein [Anaerolineae bacterium]|jgi:uncharacterized radical SAM superfamily protein|nr:radical SAM protein [Chloroflexota bacterium]
MQVVTTAQLDLAPPQELRQAPLSSLLASAWEVRRREHAPTLRLIRPTATTTLSVTGSACALHCAHCDTRYLQHMQTLEGFQPGQARSCLVSGGCDPHGMVPLTEHAEALRKLAGQLRLNLHVGTMDASTLARLDIPAAAISLDVVGCAETMRLVYGLERSLEQTLEQLVALRACGTVVPHVTIGLHGGKIRGEYRALDGLAALDPEQVVLIVLIPTAGTRFAACQPPDPDEVARVMAYARIRLPHSRLTLGCMRPYGAYRSAIDRLALSAGVNAIVNPSRSVPAAAAEEGLSISWGDECCALD